MNKKKQFTLKEIANALVQEGIQRTTTGKWSVSFQEIRERFGIDLSADSDAGRLMLIALKQEKGAVPHGGPAPAHCVRQSRPLQGFPPLLKEMALRCRIWNNRFLDRCFNSPKAQKFQRMMRCFGRFL